MLTRVEAEIAAYFNRKHCILLGSGTTALFVAFTGKGLLAGERVLFPTITCETAVNAAIFAGLTPVFYDVEITTFNLAISKASFPSGNDTIAAIVPTHIFGHLMNVASLEDLLPPHETLIVEDAAQGYGGKLNGRKAGEMGDVSILSFGPGKLLDCEGGGALLTDSDDLNEKCRMVADSLNDNPEVRFQARSRLMKEMFLLRKETKKLKEFITKRSELLRQYRDGYVFKIEAKTIAHLAQKFAGFDNVVNTRREQQNILSQILADNELVTLPNLQGTPVFWRFSFLVSPQIRDDLFNALSRQDLRVSKLFEPMHRQYAYNDTDFPHATFIYERIINVMFEFNGRSAEEVAHIIKETVYESFSRSGKKDSASL